MQFYMFLCIVVMISADLVNTQTDSFSLVILLAQPAKALS